MDLPSPADAMYCVVDDCPSYICNGPHVSHRCPNGDTTTKRADNPDPCPFCGAEF